MSVSPAGRAGIDMSAGTIIIGLVLFTVATMILYAWGLAKQRSQPKDLMDMLFSKGAAQVRKSLKENKYVTLGDVEKMSEGLEAKMPFSRNRAVVKNKKDFARQLMEYMEKTGQAEKEGGRYKAPEGGGRIGRRGA